MKLANTLALLALLGASACAKSGSVDLSTEPEAAPEAAAAPEAEPEPEPEPAAEDPSDVHIVGDHIQIDHKILFANDSDEILPESSEILDHLAKALTNHGEFTTLHVVGHTDSKGDDAHNQELSERRAKAVVAALQERGVTQSMDGRGAGETELACSDDTDECHENNRRVEFIVEK